MEIMSPLRAGGGTSPFQKRTATRGGKHGIKATSTARRRGGFSKTGAKGSNVHGYNVATRFSPFADPSLQNPLAGKTGGSGGGGKGGGGGGGGDTYHYTIGDIDMGDITTGDQSNINEQINNQNAGSLPTYKEAWRKMSVEKKEKYGGDYSKFVEESEKWWASDAGKKYRANLKQKNKQNQKVNQSNVQEKIGHTLIIGGKPIKL